MAIIKGFRKKADRKQGLKILIYGTDGVSKSTTVLGFPRIAIIDTESKLGVYENHPVFGKNIEAIADTAEYYEVCSLMEEVSKHSDDFSTFVIDSETNLYESMQVSMMELEEARAKKKGGNIDDSTVSMRGWGKVKLNNARLKNLKCQLSAKGITIISIAHKEDEMQKVGENNVKVGEKPSLRKNSTHDYDVIIRMYKEKDIATGKPKFMAEVEKDTTMTFAIGEKIDTTWADSSNPTNVIYERLSKYINGMEDKKVVETSYDKSIQTTVDKGLQADVTFEEVSDKFTKLFAKLGEHDVTLKGEYAEMLKTKGVKSYKDVAYFEEMKEIVAHMENKANELGIK